MFQVVQAGDECAINGNDCRYYYHRHPDLFWMRPDLHITCQALPGTEPMLTIERAFSETAC